MFGLPDWVLHSGQRLQASVFSSRLSMAICWAVPGSGEGERVGEAGLEVTASIIIHGLADCNQFFLEPSRNRLY